MGTVRSSGEISGIGVLYDSAAACVPELRGVGEPYRPPDPHSRELPAPKPVYGAPSAADPCGMARFQPFGPVRVAMPAESPARRDWPVSAPRRGILIDVACSGY